MDVSTCVLGLSSNFRKWPRHDRLSVSLKFWLLCHGIPSGLPKIPLQIFPTWLNMGPSSTAAGWRFGRYLVLWTLKCFAIGWLPSYRLGFHSHVWCNRRMYPSNSHCVLVISQYRWSQHRMAHTRTLRPAHGQKTLDMAGVRSWLGWLYKANYPDISR